MGEALYAHMDQAGGFAAAGWYKLQPKALKPFRQKIINDAAGFDSVREAFTKAGRWLADNDTLNSMPRGFEDHSDHRHADVIKLKSPVLFESLPNSAFPSGEVAHRLETLARDAMPLLTFFRSAS